MKSHTFPIKLFVFGLVALLALTACERPSPRPTEVPDVGNPPQQVTTAPPATAIPAPAETAVSTDATPIGEDAGTEGAEADDAGAGESSTDTEDGSVDEPAVEGDATAVPADSNTPITEEQTHTVAAGDSLYRLSLIYGASIAEIAAANNISETSTLDIGQTLTIPVPGTVEVDTAPPENTGEERIHIVQAGENLFRIGLQYGFTVDELASHNGIANPDRLEVGQQIRIPANN